MRKWMIIVAFSSCSLAINAQVEGGEVVDSGRELLTENAVFKIQSEKSGTVLLELAVNRLGIVTSSRILIDGTTILSTPSRMKAQNMSKKLTFTAGTRFAEFEHVVVKYTYGK